MKLHEIVQQHAEQSPQKIALVVDQITYTYKELWDAILRERQEQLEQRTQLGHQEQQEQQERQERQIQQAPQKSNDSSRLKLRGVKYIDEVSFERQVIAWFAALEQSHRPIIMHSDLPAEIKKKIQMRNEHCPYEMADFGVLTSGSTGIPKVLWRASHTWVDFFPIQNNIFHISDDTCLFLHGSYSFTGNMNALLSVLYEGGTVVTTNHFSPKTWIALCKKHHVNTLYLLPTKLRLLLSALAQQTICEGWTHTVETIFTGSQLVDKKLMDGVGQYFANAEMLLYYGASELNYISWCTSAEWYAEPNTVGKAFSGIEISVIENQIFVDTPYAVEGINRPYCGGDTGWISKTGRLIFERRSTAVINYGGRKISIPDMEMHLKGINGIRDAVVIATTDELRGEVPIAYIVPDLEVSTCVQDVGVATQTSASDMFNVENDNLIHDTQLHNVLSTRIRKELPTALYPRQVVLIRNIPLNSSSKPDTRKLLTWAPPVIQ